MHRKVGLNAIVQGVDFNLNEHGQPLRCLVLAAYLKQRYGAGETPSSWLAAFEGHEAEIRGLARAKWLATGRAPVVLGLRDDP